MNIESEVRQRTVVDRVVLELELTGEEAAALKRFVGKIGYKNLAPLMDIPWVSSSRDEATDPRLKIIRKLVSLIYDELKSVGVEAS